MFEEIKEIIVEELGVDEDKVVETATFKYLVFSPS